MSRRLAVALAICGLAWLSAFLLFLVRYVDFSGSMADPRTWILVLAAAGLLLAGALGVFNIHLLRQILRRQVGRLQSDMRERQIAIDRGQVEIARRVQDLASDFGAFVKTRQRSAAEIERRLKSLSKSFAQASEELGCQAEGIISLYATLQPRVPLPPLQGWAVTAEAGATLVRLIAEDRPTSILELGSGSSTLLIALALERFGIQAHVASVEHHIDHLARTAAGLEQEGLRQRVELIHAPLTSIRIGEAAYQWYEPSFIERIEMIDMLVIDGPPGDTCPKARFPALPLLRKKLALGARILLDDANRDDESTILATWREEFPDVQWLAPRSTGIGLAVGRRGATLDAESVRNNFLGAIR